MTATMRQQRDLSVHTTKPLRSILLMVWACIMTAAAAPSISLAFSAPSISLAFSSFQPRLSFTTSTRTARLSYYSNNNAYYISTTTAMTATSSSSSPSNKAKKGFGGGSSSSTPPKTPSPGQIQRDQERQRYDAIAQQGSGQEYKIFVRQFGSGDNKDKDTSSSSWLPCGSIAVPRSAQVSDAIYANVPALQAAIVRTYPKLKGYESEFEYGYNLKIYPDDPIEVAIKNSSSLAKNAGWSIGNWISNLLSPVDVSKVKATPPPSSNPPPPSSST